jgi:hypothetical protein
MMKNDKPEKGDYDMTTKTAKIGFTVPVEVTFSIPLEYCDAITIDDLHDMIRCNIPCDFKADLQVNAVMQMKQIEATIECNARDDDFSTTDIDGALDGVEERRY